MDDYDLYNSDSDDQFDKLLSLACYICNCDVAYISLIENNWQNIRYAKGIEPQEAPLDDVVCKFPYHEKKFVQIANILKHPKTESLFEHSPSKLKFYAGIPLTSKNEVVGTLCVCSEEEKTLNPNQEESFKLLAEQVINILVLRKRNIQKNQTKKITDEYEILFNSSPDLICILNDCTEIISINKSSLNILGYKPEECIGVKMSKFFNREDEKLVFDLANSSLQQKIKNFEVETRIKTKTQETKWISWNAVAKDRTWFIIGREITKQKEILKNLNQLSTVASKINNGVVISNAKSEVIWVNNAFTKITGFTLEDLTDKKLGDVIVGAETNKELVEKARLETTNKKSFAVELLAYRKDGQQIWLSIHNSIILDNNGDIESLIEIIIDITKRKESEQRLELLSLVASKTNNGVSICDKEGNVTWINEALENILGYTNKEVFSKKIGDLVKGKDTDLSILETAREKALKGHPYNIELKVYRKNRTEVWLSIANTPLHDKSKNLYYQIEIISDVTERKQAEMQLLASKEEALQLSKAKEMFVSVMSHEIRTPLNAVIGLSNILHDDEKLEAQIQPINLLKFSADNLLNLINDILDFSKIEVGKMELENKRLSIRDLITDIVDSFVFKIKEKDLKLVYQINDNIPPLVRGDKTRLYQILVNLINNAIKFTEEGSITILVNLVTEINQKVEISFEIIDTGIGVASDKLSTIFEPFTQAETNTTRKYGGSGLGLSITQKLVSLFGGTISISSELGKGTTFSINLIFNKFEEVDEIAKMETPKVLININARVLVVDDNEINTLLAKKVLTKYGLTVTTTDSGLSAIDLLKSKAFDLVLMDVHMPIMDGYETTKTLRNQPDDYFKTLPIIALTASIMVDNLHEIEACGMNDYQIKPFKPDELIEKIAKHLKV